jgi:hypothetical protein
MDRVRLQRRCERARWLGLALLGISWFVSAPAQADVPSLLPIQGYLTDKQGKALDGSPEITFRLYSTATAGTPFHEETISVVVVEGHFNVYLGDDSVNPLALSELRDNAKVFLAIEVEKDGEGVPRLQLASTAFAAQAAYCGDATNLGGKAPTDYASNAHTHSFDDILGKPLGYPPAPHVHGSADIMSYADLGDEGYLNNDDANDLLTQSQGDGRFAGKSHSHDASDIQNGTLSDARYSSYADLYTEGYLNNDNANDLPTQGQGDARWVKRGEALSVTSPMLASVRMDKTTAPIGVNQASAAIPGGTNQYIFPPGALVADANGTCVLTATARVFNSAALPPNSSFYVYPAVEINSSPTNFGNFAFGSAAPGTGWYATGPALGQFDVVNGNSYRFGCYISVSNTTGFGGLSFSCVISWVCN